MQRHTTWSRIWLITATAFALGLGCGGSSSGSGAAGCTVDTATAVTTATVIALRSPMTFSPSCMKTSAGTVLTFRNDDAIQHTVTDLDHQPPTFDSGPLSPAATYQHAYAAAGTYKVYCTIHGVAMQATVFVQ